MKRGPLDTARFKKKQLPKISIAEKNRPGSWVALPVEMGFVWLFEGWIGCSVDAYFFQIPPEVRCFRYVLGCPVFGSKYVRTSVFGSRSGMMIEVFFFQKAWHTNCPQNHEK